MKIPIHILLFFILITMVSIGYSQDTLMIKGQVSGWANYNYTNESLLLGGRYIPEGYYLYEFSKGNKIDIETSANIYGTWLDFSDTDGKIKPYRAWVRYSTAQYEFRAGLQKINFGSASMLRPLMWFDRMDPRDPLQLTDGVWGVLGRYYFLNNANIWLWGLYGNKDTKGWEWASSTKDYPELGGRVQLPIPTGEIAATYHHREMDLSGQDVIMPRFLRAKEDRYGFDARIDWVVGFWLEGAWVRSRRSIGALTNQTILNAGVDYTFSLGNGLHTIYEHLLTSSDTHAFDMGNTVNFSLLSLSYPIGIFDNVGAIAYYNWENEQVYTFLNWQRQYDRLSIHLMAYWNPESFDLPQQNLGSNMFGGKGAQVMLVFNH